MKRKQQATASGEDYLEAILVIQMHKGAVRSVDIARHMEVSKPSVCHAVNTLKNGGFLIMDDDHFLHCALPGFVDSKNEEKTERNAGYLVVSQSGGGMLRQGTREGIRRTPANRGMRAHRIVKGLDISEDVCHGMCP